MTALNALDGLLNALKSLARALEAGDADAVLSLEVEIARATRAVASIDRGATRAVASIDRGATRAVASIDRSATRTLANVERGAAGIRGEIADRVSATRAELIRCRALGESVAGLAAVVTNPTRTYDRGGRFNART